MIKRILLPLSLILTLVLISLTVTAEDINNVSWNLKNFGKSAALDPKKQDRLMAMKQILQRLHPGVLAVQEMLNEEGTAAFTGMLPADYSFRCSSFSGTRHQGNCVFWDSARFEEAGDVDMDIETQHPPRAVYLRDKKSGFDFYIVSLHLKFGQDKETRVDELKKIIAFIRENLVPKDPDVLIAGDFNLTMEEVSAVMPLDEFTVYINGLTSRKRNRAGSSNYDHFIVSKSMIQNNRLDNPASISDQTVLETENENNDVMTSDHFPVVYIFDLKTDVKK